MGRTGRERPIAYPSSNKTLKFTVVRSATRVSELRIALQISQKMTCPPIERSRHEAHWWFGFERLSCSTAAWTVPATVEGSEANAKKARAEAELGKGWSHGPAE